mmetsp:Transcript_6526/g.17487  ORF Transcript_6526/g.17487 Transcript_6526/m.17487 type:complete len:101 (-) Transcript_6526:1179-1481(-)
MPHKISTRGKTRIAMLAHMHSLPFMHRKTMPAQIRLATEFALAIWAPPCLHLIVLFALVPTGIVMPFEALMTEHAVKSELFECSVVRRKRRAGNARSSSS